jgi:hypothetical protein
MNELNIFILNNKIVNYRSLCNHKILRTENIRIAKNTTNKDDKHRAPAIKMAVPTYFARQNMAEFMIIIIIIQFNSILIYLHANLTVNGQLQSEHE